MPGKPPPTNSATISTAAAASGIQMRGRPSSRTTATPTRLGRGPRSNWSRVAQTCAWRLLRGLDGRGLAANQRFEQALFGNAPAARRASVFGAATQMLGDRVLLLGCEFAVGVHREVLSYVVLAVHGSPCLYTQARLI